MHAAGFVVVDQQSFKLVARGPQERISLFRPAHRDLDTPVTDILDVVLVRDSSLEDDVRQDEKILVLPSQVLLEHIEPVVQALYFLGELGALPAEIAEPAGEVTKHYRGDTGGDQNQDYERGNHDGSLETTLRTALV